MPDVDHSGEASHRKKQNNRHCKYPPLTSEPKCKRIFRKPTIVTTSKDRRVVSFWKFDQ